MIVSMPMAVLPVLRSPMISSRWPRPMGVMASMALMPVCSGSRTGCRPAMPGAMNSTGRRSVVTIGPLPSSGLPSGSTTRPITASPTGTLSSRPVLRDLVAFVDREVVAENDDADGVLFEVEGQAVDAAGKLDHFAGHDARQAVDARDAVAHLDHAADLADVDLRLVLLNFLLDYGSDLVGFEFHGRSCRSFVCGHGASRVATEPS